MTDPKSSARTTASGAVELDEAALESASGGYEAWPSKWKGFSLNGKGDSAAHGSNVEEVTLVVEKIEKG